MAKEDILTMLDNYEGYIPQIRQQILNDAYEEIDQLRSALLTIYHINEAYGSHPTKRTISKTVIEAMKMKEITND